MKQLPRMLFQVPLLCSSAKSGVKVAHLSDSRICAVEQPPHLGKLRGLWSTFYRHLITLERNSISQAKASTLGFDKEVPGLVVLRISIQRATHFIFYSNSSMTRYSLTFLGRCSIRNKHQILSCYIIFGNSQMVVFLPFFLFFTIGEYWR